VNAQPQFLSDRLRFQFAKFRVQLFVSFLPPLSPGPWSFSAALALRTMSTHLKSSKGVPQPAPELTVKMNEWKEKVKNTALKCINETMAQKCLALTDRLAVRKFRIALIFPPFFLAYEAVRCRDAIHVISHRSSIFSATTSPDRPFIL